MCCKPHPHCVHGQIFSGVCWCSCHSCQHCKSAVKGRNCRGQTNCVFLLLYTVCGCLALLLFFSEFLLFCGVPAVAHHRQLWEARCALVVWALTNWPRMPSLCFAGGVVQNGCHIISSPNAYSLNGRARKGSQNQCSMKLQGKYARFVNLWPGVSFCLQRKLFIVSVKKPFVSVVLHLKSENGNRYMAEYEDFFFIALINIPSFIHFLLHLFMF